MSVRDFAAHLGINERMVSKWEAGGDSVHPRPANQQVLDVTLARADETTRQRFQRFASRRGAAPPQADAGSSAGSGGGVHVRPDETGFALSPVTGPADQASAASRRVIQVAFLGDEEPSSEPLLAAAVAVRREVEDTLAAGTISPTRLDRLEELVGSHIRVYTTTAPAHALANLLVDIMDVRRLASQRQPAMMEPVVGHRIEAGVLTQRAEDRGGQEHPAEWVAGPAPGQHDTQHADGTGGPHRQRAAAGVDALVRETGQRRVHGDQHQQQAAENQDAHR